MVFFIDEARSRPPRLLTNVNKKMVFFIEGFPYGNMSLPTLQSNTNDARGGADGLIYIIRRYQ